MKATLIAAMLAMFAATASAKECEYLSKYRIAPAALDAELKGHDLKMTCVNQCDEQRGGAYTGIRRTIIFGVTY